MLNPPSTSGFPSRKYAIEISQLAEALTIFRAEGIRERKT
jgi:hypothetical protein